MRWSHENELAASQFEQVIGNHVTSRKIVSPNKVELTARGERAEVTVEEYHCNSGLPQTLGKASVNFLWF
jgi:hypothetical protein